MAIKSINEIIPRLQQTNAGVTSTPAVYIDDMFDPLFNKYAREYLRNKYGDNVLLNTLAGYGEGITNAWGNKQGKGILGPTMGVLGYFGRSLDKADDALLGSLIEASDPTGFNNPLEQIFIEDRPYEGKELIKNLINQTRKDPNKQLKDEDLQGLLPTLGGLAIDLATDPGILGGTLSKIGSKSTKPILKNLGQVGELMSDYDNMAAMLAWNAVAPGSTFAAKKFLGKAGQILGWDKSKDLVNVATKDSKAQTVSETFKPKDPNIPAPVLRKELLPQGTPVVKNAKTINEAVKKAPKAVAATVAPKDNLTQFVENGVKAVKESYKPKDVFNPEVEQIADQVAKIEAKPKVADTVVEPVAKNVPELTTYEDAVKEVQGLGAPTMESQVKNIGKYTEVENIGGRNVIMGIKGVEGGQGIPLTAPSGSFVNQNVITPDRIDAALKEIDNVEIRPILEEIKEAGGWERYVEENWDGSVLDYPEIQALQNKVLNALEEFEGSTFRYIKSGGTERFIVRPSQYYPLKQYAPVKKYVDSWVAVLKNKIETSLGRKVGLKEFRTRIFEAFGWAEKDVDSLLSNYKKAWDYQLKNKKLLKEFKRIPKTDTLGRAQYLENLAKIDPQFAKSIEFIIKYGDAKFFVEGIDKFLKWGFLEEVPEAIRFKRETKKPFSILNTYEMYKKGIEEFNKAMSSKYAKKILSKGKVLGDDLSRMIVSGLDELSDNLSSLNKKIVSVTGSGFSSDAFESITKEIGDILTPNTLVKSFLESIPLPATRAIRSGIVEITPEILAAAKKEEDAIRKILKDFPEIEVIDRVTGKKLQTLIESELDPSKVAAGQVSPLQFVKRNYNPATVLTKVTEEKLTQAVNKVLTTPSKELPPIVPNATIPDPIKATQETLKAGPVEEALNTAIETAMKQEYPTTPVSFAEQMDVFRTTTKRETLFSRISKAITSSSNIASKNYSASLDNPKIREIVAKIASIKDIPMVKRFIKSMDEAQPYISKKQSVLVDLVKSNGYKLTVVKDASQRALLRKQLQKLANIVNESARKMGAKGDILLLNKDNADGVVGIFLNEGTEGFQNYFTKIAKSQIDGKFIFNEDIIWYNNKGAKAFAEEGAEAALVKQSYQEGIDELRKHVTKLGHKDELDALLENGTQYLHHTVVANDKLTKKLLNTFVYVDKTGKEIAMNVEELGKYSNSIGNYLNLNKKFRSIFSGRSYEGPMGLFQDNELGKLFEDDDLAKIMNGTLSEGVLANKNYQLFLNLFENDNLKVSQMFKSSKELKTALFAIDPITKSVGGNINQLDVVIPVYKNGSLTSFKRIDKFSDKALEEAFATGEAVLLPNTLYGSLDRLLKKDAILSNKAYLVFNKYFTLPFKFGVLTNPAFPIGNLNDAFFKTATELGAKYDRSFLEASVKTTSAMMDVVKLENTMTDIVENYLKNWARPGELFTPQMLIKDGKARKRFFEYLDAGASQKLITPEQAEQWKSVSMLYMYMNRVQDTTVTNFFSNKMLERLKAFDLEQYSVTQELSKGLDAVDIISKYSVQTNAFEKIIYGNKKTFGLFFNNPVNNGIMAASSGIENMMRSAHILAILKEEGIIEEIGKRSPGIKKSLFAESEKLNINFQNAVNSMNAAHFNYDNVTDIMAGISTVIPFPIFMLKNLGFWLNKAIDNPQILDNVISVHENLWSDKNKAAQKDEFLGEAKGRGAVPALGSILKPTPYGSLFSAFDTITNPVSNVAYRLNPMTRLLTQAVLPAEDVKYRPYTTDVYTPNVKRGEPDFSYMRYALQSLNPFERQIQNALRLPAKLEQGNVQIADVLPSVFQPDFSKKKRKK
jgi:hypothetical protein